jgi:hypothetical protein
MRLNAMNVQTNNLAQSARGESLCRFCGRQWFGSVAYCPYCGRKPGLTTQEPDVRPQIDEALAGGQGPLGMPAGELQWQDPKSARKEPRGTPWRVTGSLPRWLHAVRQSHVRDRSPLRQMDPESVAPLQGVPISGETPPGKRDRPTPSQLNKTASTLLFTTVVAGVCGLLLLWMLVKLLAPKTNEGASPQLPVSSSGIASPRPGPSTSAAQVPSIPPRTDTAVPAADPAVRQQERGAAQAAPQSNRSLCSVASEAAGLCKSQE